MSFTRIDLTISGRCNLRCGYCYAEHGQFGSHNDSVMKKSVAFNAVDWFISQADTDELLISFLGGEPLLEFEFMKDIVDYANSLAKKSGKSLFFSVSTNGTLFSDEIVAFLEKNNFGVGVSIQSSKAKVHDYSRPFLGGKGSFDMIIKGIKKFRNKDLLKIKKQFTRGNAGFVEDYCFFVSEGFRNFTFGPIRSDDPRFYLSDSDILDYSQELKEYAEIVVDSWSKGKSFDLMPDIAAGLKQVKDRDCNSKFCGGGRWSVATSVEGDLYPCHTLVGVNKYMIGDIFSGIDEEKKEKFLDFVSINKRKKCLCCEYMDVCSGSCFANWLYGDHGPDNLDESICKLIKEGLKTSEFLLRKAKDFGAVFE